MSDIETLVKNYLDLWNIAEPAARRAAIDEYLTDDVEYVDPNVAVRGKDALDSYIAVTQRYMPGLVFSLAGEVTAHHAVACFTWNFGRGGEDVPALSGCDFAATKNGKICRLYGFFSGPSEFS